MAISVLYKLVKVFTLERARVYALVIMGVTTLVIFTAFLESPGRLTGETDFPAFYNAGRILNTNSGSRLYDHELQKQLYRELAPATASQRNLFFVYTPFFALVFAPLALLPYLGAFVCWILISVGLFTAGFFIIWSAASLPARHRLDAFLVAMAFLPFFSWCLFTGQTSAFGFFWLALAMYLDRKGQTFMSGCALALLLYKPTLLVLLVPMLVITKRWRTLGGFCLTAVALVFISFALIGSAGFNLYLNMLASFSEDKATGRHPNWADIDAFSFFLPLVNGDSGLAQALALILGILVLPFLLTSWRRDRDQSWAIAITWTLVLNFYVLIYDATLIILSVVISIEAWVASQRNLPLSVRWLLLVLFLIPWVETNLARHYGLHPMTIVLVAFGSYQLFRILRLKHVH